MPLVRVPAFGEVDGPRVGALGRYLAAHPDALTELTTYEEPHREPWEAFATWKLWVEITGNCRYRGWNKFRFRTQQEQQQAAAWLSDVAERRILLH